MSLTHSDIAPAANRGEAADAGNLYTHPGPPSSYRSGFWSNSWMAEGMAQALTALSEIGLKAEQTIWSFNTPIAMRFGNVWIMADTNYSSRTSQQISKLGARWNRTGLSGRIERVPGDITAAELRRVIDGKMSYVLPSTKTQVGRFVAGPNYTAE